MSTLPKFILLTTAGLLFSSSVESAKLTKRAYKKNIEQSGVVLLDVNWGRRWNCGGYENAQLISIRLENISAENSQSSKYSGITVKTPSRTFVNSEFLNYGFIVKPGKYALIEWSIKVSKSMTDVGNLKAGEKELVVGEKYLGGTFDLGQGEVIYIGNFFLDCLQSPIPWRFYTTTENYEKHKSEYKSRFPFLEDKNIVFRLLQSGYYGNDEVLP